MGRTCTRHRPESDCSKGGRCAAAALPATPDTSAMSAAERGMVALGGITYSPCTSYLQHTPGNNDSAMRTACHTDRHPTGRMVVQGEQAKWQSLIRVHTGASLLRGSALCKPFSSLLCAQQQDCRAVQHQNTEKWASFPAHTA